MTQIHHQYGHSTTRLDETPFAPLTGLDGTLLLDKLTRSLLEDEVRACGRFWSLERSEGFDEGAFGVGEERVREFFLLKQRRTKYVSM